MMSDLIKYPRHLHSYVCGFVLLSLSTISLSETAPIDQSFSEKLIEKNKEISKEIDDAVRKTDIYLSDKEYVDGPNKTTITLHNNFGWKEQGEYSYKPHVGVKLHLPNLQKKLQLRFTSYDEDAESRGINKNRYKTTERKENYGTSFALFQDLGKVKTEFRPRVEYTDQFETSYLLTFNSEADIGILNIDPEIQLFARSDTGTGQFVGLNFDFQVSPSNLLTLVNEEQYTDYDNTLTTNNGIQWDHTYNKRLSQEYSLIFESNNRAKYHLEKFVLETSFQHKFYINVLHYAVTPYLLFEKINRFHPSCGMDFKVDIIF